VKQATRDFNTTFASKLSGMNSSQGDGENSINYQEKIMLYQDQINNQVKVLDTQLEAILEKLEKSTLTAYRYHMLKVQKDLVALKQKSNEEELKTEQEGKLANLDKQIQAIRQDCMQTRAFCDQ